MRNVTPNRRQYEREGPDNLSEQELDNVASWPPQWQFLGRKSYMSILNICLCTGLVVAEAQPATFPVGPTVSAPEGADRWYTENPTVDGESAP